MGRSIVELFNRINNFSQPDQTLSSSEQRNIKLSNFISLIMAVEILCIILFRAATGKLGIQMLTPLAFEIFVFLLVPLLNKLGRTLFSRLVLCWAPAILLLINFKVLILQVPTPETSHYVGFRIFQIAFSFFPFLVFNVSDWRKFLLALSVPIICIVFYDQVLVLLGVGYFQLGLTEESYSYNTFRTIISLAVIISSFLVLKRIIENQERINRNLIRELAEKNEIIRQQAKEEVSQLNDQLSANLDQLASSEKKLVQAYERLSYHINHTPLAVIERDKNLKIRFWNKRAEELFGWTSEEVIGKRPQDFLVPIDDYEIATAWMTGALKDGVKSDLQERRIVSKHGKIMHCLWYYSFLRDERGEIETILSFASDITEQRIATHLLGERIKELQTLYNMSQLLTSESENMERVFSQVPLLVPPGWQFPDICACRLKVYESVYSTQNFNETEFKQVANINIDGREIGFIEVVYLKETPPEYEGPFFKEERNLINVLAEMLQTYITRKQKEDALTKAQANLNATINNTEIMIWSVDKNFDLITFNEPFRKYNEKYRNIVIEPGTNHRQYFDDETSRKWEERYLRALSGENVVIEDTTPNNQDYRFSLSPIIEHNRVTGVSVFADNITERNQRTRELADANKKINDLKLMALRSAMNPHFIFNVLSSIQYFITKNDELNAINYLTSFSKLMRTVLTRSVADSVTLKEEMELLENYIHLEKLRFEEKFNYTLQSDQSLDTENIRIPSLLIQPYVENAILHGLYNKDGAGNLTIRVHSDDDYLVFEIEDDGIGREAAAKIGMAKQSNRKSMGTQLTEERLKILNSDSELAVTYDDLFDGSKPSGTRVKIRIRLNPN